MDELNSRLLAILSRKVPKLGGVDIRYFISYSSIFGIYPKLSKEISLLIIFKIGLANLFIILTGIDNDDWKLVKLYIWFWLKFILELIEGIGELS